MDDAKRTERLEAEVDADLIGAVREIAREQGRDVGSVVDEALADLVVKTRAGKPRPEVMALHEEAIARYHDVFKKLAE